MLLNLFIFAYRIFIKNIPTEYITNEKYIDLHVIKSLYSNIESLSKNIPTCSKN